MITYNDKWETLSKQGKYLVRRQWIAPHNRYLYQVASVKTYRRNVDSPPDDTVRRLGQDMSDWDLKKCERWLAAKA